MKTIVISCLLLIGCSPKKDQPSDFDLQAKCAAAAKDFFPSHAREEDEATMVMTYTNHYNKELGKCLISIEDSHHALQLPNEKTRSLFTGITVYDVFENRELSDFGKLTDTQAVPYKISDTLTACKVMETGCSSEAEYKKAIAILMSK